MTDEKAIHNALEALLIAEIGVAGALFGVLIAGLAIFAAFLSADYLAVLRGTRAGIEGDLWPFWWVSAWTVITILVAGAGLVLREQSPCLEHELFLISTFVATYTIFGALSLVGFIVMQGGSRARQILGPESEPDAPQRK